MMERNDARAVDDQGRARSIYKKIMTANGKACSLLGKAFYFISVHQEPMNIYYALQELIIIPALQRRQSNLPGTLK